MGRAAGIVVCVALAAAPAARAGNNDVVPLSDLAAVTSGAVVAAGDDGGQVTYNPAGLVGIPRNSVSISASLFEVRRVDVPGFIRTATPDGPVESRDSDTALNSVPTAVIFARKARPGLAYAISVTVPQSNVIDTDRRNNLVTAGTLMVRETARSVVASSIYRAGATIAWALAPQLRLGATLNLALVRTTQVFAFELSALDADGRRTYVNSQAVERATAGALGGILGLQWFVTRRFATGISVEPPLLGLVGTDKVDQSRFFTRTANGQPSLTTDTAMSTSTSLGGEGIGRLVARWGVAYTADWGWVSAQVDHRPGGDHGVTNGHLGGIYALSSSLRIGAGGFTDFNTQPSTSAVRFSFAGGTAGLLWRKPLALTRSSSPLLLGTTLAVRYAYGWGQATSISSTPDTDDPAQFVVETSTPGTIHEVSLYIGTSVDF